MAFNHRKGINILAYSHTTIDRFVHKFLAPFKKQLG